ncbi:MAG: parA [Actinomycetia bacterium]|nr:parA [Actinomycetes bacterium]
MADVVEGFPDPTDRSRAIFERLRGDVATEDDPAPPAASADAPPVAPPPRVFDQLAEEPLVAPEDAVEPAPEPVRPEPEPEPEPEPTAAVASAPPSAPATTRSLPTVDEGELALPTPPAPVSTAPEAVPEAPPSPFARPLPRVMAVANQKGGVGKTTTAVNLGACLAELGYRVLVCDLDPQGNASTGLGLNPRNMQTSMYDVILNDVPLEDCVEPSSVRNLFVAPASLDLAGAEIELVPAFSRELRLKRAIEAAADDYDFVLIDCPPSLGLLTVNGLAAATEVIVPIQCEYYALEGLGQLLRNVALVQKNLNPRLEVSAIICVMYDARTKLSDQVVQEVRAHFGDKVCRNVVPRTVRLSEAPSFGQPIIAFDPTSRGAIAYRELAKEVSGGAPIRTR